jgi:hypothetical protein
MPAKTRPAAQADRLDQLFRITSAAKAKGCKTTRVRITDLEQLIAIAAATDAGLIPTHLNQVRS